MYEVLTGKLPFEAKSAMDYLSLHVSGKPTPLSQRVAGKSFPPLLDKIIDRALSKKVEERFGSMTDFGVALQAVLEGKRELPATAVPAVAAPSAPGSVPSAPNVQDDLAPTAADIPKSGRGLLIGVAVACLLAGVILTVVVTAFFKK